MKFIGIRPIIALGAGLFLLSGCGSKEPAEQPPPPPPPVQKTATPKPVKETPAAEVKGAEQPAAKPPAAGGAQTAKVIRSYGDQARMVVKEIRSITNQMRKISGDIDGNTDRIYVQKDKAAIQATKKQIEVFNDLSRKLDRETTKLNKIIEQMSSKINAMKK